MNSTKSILPTIFGILFAILGLLLAVGGLYLIILGGSWFYLLAGLAMIGVGAGLINRCAWALRFALGLLLFSLIWAFWEVGFDFWQLVPRLIAFLVVALITVLFGPQLFRFNGTKALSGKMAAIFAVVLGVALIGMFAAMFWPHPEVVADGKPVKVIKPDAAAKSGNDWSAWGRNTMGDRYVQFDQINKANVKDLKVAWTYRTGDLAVDGAEYQVTPLKVDNTLYLCTPLNKVIALDAVTGKEKWRFDPKPAISASAKGWKRCRGVAYADLNKLIKNVPVEPLPVVEEKPAKAPKKVASAYPVEIRKAQTATQRPRPAAKPSAPRKSVQTSNNRNRLVASSASAMKPKKATNTAPSFAEKAQPIPLSTASCRQRIYTTTIDARLLALDANTGKLCEGFGQHGAINLREGLGPDAKTGEPGSYYLTSAPLVADGVVLVGGKINDNLSVNEPSGVVRGYNAETGKLLWAFDPANPNNTTPLPEGKTYSRESPNFWGTASYDPKLGLAYIPTGNQTPDFWTGNRHPYSNEFNDSIIALELKTGKMRWHFRTANIDAFDYDVTSQPILYDRPNADGSVTPLLIQLTKRGQVFVLDRRDGKPVFPVEQRNVATDVMPGMQVAKTQPYSAISVGATPFKESDMWGASIFDQLYCRIQFKKMRWEGEFTPLSDKKRTMIYPGYYGGMNWGGGSVDAATGTLIVNDIRMAQWGHFIKQEEAARTGLKPSTEGEYSTQTGTPWGVERSMFVSPLGIPCFKPPFGSLTAIDLTTGKTRWQVPLGTIKDAPVHGIAPGLPIPIGMPTMGSPMVTKGGLTFFHGSLDYYLRAMDNDTGKEVWRTRLPVGGQGTPMSYIGKDGKQYIVVVVGGATRTGSNNNRGDYVIAYKLP